MRDVAFSCDDNGVRFLKVAVWSMLAHYRGDKPIRVNVFDGFGGHSEQHRAEMRELVARFPKATLRYVNAEPAVEPYRDLILDRPNSRWNVFTWTPIFTPQLLPDATGNVIHFDIDMLFNDDVTELFEIDLGQGLRSRSTVEGNSYLIACAYEYDKFGENAGRVVWEKGILPPIVDRYFNTGVIVFNAEACRAERTWEKIIAWYRAHYALADRIEQDAWNALYHDRMKPLNIKWNFHDRAIKNYARWPLGATYWLGNTPFDCLSAALKPSLLHFWGPKKPWKVSHRPYRKLYHAAMRAVGEKPPREPLLAPLYDLKTALDLRRIARHRYLLDPKNREEVSRRMWTRRKRMKRIKEMLLAPFEWALITLGFVTLAGLPHRAMLAVCDLLSRVMYAFDGRGRAYARENLRTIRPGLSPRDEERIIRRSYRNMARTVGHVFYTSFDTRARVKKVGIMDAACGAALRANRPAVTVTGHIGCWEVLAQLGVLEGHAMMSVAKRIGSPGMTRLLVRSRRAIGQEIVLADGAFKPLMRGVQGGKSPGLVVDQHVDPENGGVWVRFFGRPLPVSAAPAFFAAKGRVPIIVGWSRPLRDGRYRCELVDVISSSEARDIWGTTQRIANDLAGVIRRHPSCWVLNYNLFSNIPSEKDLADLAAREKGA